MHYLSCCNSNIIIVLLFFVCLFLQLLTKVARTASPVLRLQVIWTKTNPLLFCVLYSGRLFTGSVCFQCCLFVCLFLGRLLQTVAALLRLGSSLSAELIDTYISQSKTQKRARVHRRDPVSALSVSLKASFVVKGDQACLWAWLSAWACVLARLSVFWMLYRLKRAPGYIYVSRTRTRKAWSFGREGLTEEDVQERKRPHIHVTEGSRKILSNGLIPARFYSSAFQRAKSVADAV